MLTSGTYKLPADVRNPRPDRRYARDWRYFPVWSAGWEFVVEDQRDPSSAASYTQIILVGGRSFAIGPGHGEWYAALESALVPCEKSTKALLVSLRVDDHFASWLLESGKLDRDTFCKLWDEYQSGESSVSADGWQIGRLLPQLVLAGREGVGS